ncbi:uncharacterized protein LOC110736136 isoform X2 [Chenopodium quinoa]|uniref:uncharacterized protein LOC110730615 n=1 Tax=Chenopodium quinoa TaxID=63459 RepID=UPI000B76E989|nr:uncharacterized protein LOC110730615 [Chenopodium quinoa]XP_021771990.1 uncharacterized protein LOC110736136 isoform X2 [Chenopodium quinoa]
MGNLGSPRSPHPHPANVDFLFGMRECPARCSEGPANNDHFSGRRVVGSDYHWCKNFLFGGIYGNNSMAAKQSICKGVYGGKRHNWFHRQLRLFGFAIGLMGLFFWLDSLMFVDFNSANFRKSSVLEMNTSKLAALDFIACATADVFAMTDSGSQLSSLVSGFRTYFGGGHAPTLRPNKKRLSAILLENDTIAWNSFQYRVTKMIEEGQRVHVRRFGQSIYRQPRSPECMCKAR